MLARKKKEEAVIYVRVTDTLDARVKAHVKTLGPSDVGMRSYYNSAGGVKVAEWVRYLIEQALPPVKVETKKARAK